MDAIFEFLFKYRGIAFEQGDFAFGAPGSFRIWLGVAGVVAASAVATYTIARAKSSVVDRSIMASLRVALLRSEGEKFFCPGWDLKAAAAAYAEGAKDFLDSITDAAKRAGSDFLGGLRR